MSGGGAVAKWLPSRASHSVGLWFNPDPVPYFCLLSSSPAGDDLTEWLVHRMDKKHVGLVACFWLQIVCDMGKWPKSFSSTFQEKWKMDF